MRFGLQTWGSDGDIRPMLALAGGLRAAGHEVVLAVASVDEKDYRPEGRALDVTLRQVPSKMGARLSDLLAEVEGRSSIRGLQALLRDFFFPHVEAMHEAARELASIGDVVVGHFLMYPTRAAAVMAGRPYASVTYWPGMVPTLEEPVDELADLAVPAVPAGPSDPRGRERVARPRRPAAVPARLARHLVLRTAQPRGRQPDAVRQAP